MSGIRRPPPSFIYVIYFFACCLNTIPSICSFFMQAVYMGFMLNAQCCICLSMYINVCCMKKCLFIQIKVPCVNVVSCELENFCRQVVVLRLWFPSEVCEPPYTYFTCPIQMQQNLWALFPF